MSIKTKSELGSIWITGCCPTQADYSNLFDSTIGVVLNGDNAIRANQYGGATFNHSNGVWGCHSVDLSIAKLQDCHTSRGVRSGLFAGGSNISLGVGSVVLGGSDNKTLSDAEMSAILAGYSGCVNSPCSSIISSFSGNICVSNAMSCSLGLNFIAGACSGVVDGTASSVISSLASCAIGAACASSVIASDRGILTGCDCTECQHANILIGVRSSNTSWSMATGQIGTTCSDIYCSEISVIAASSASLVSGIGGSIVSSSYSCSCGTYASIMSSTGSQISSSGAQYSLILASNGSSIVNGNYGVIIGSNISCISSSGFNSSAIIASDCVNISNASTSVVMASCGGLIGEDFGAIAHTVSIGKGVLAFMPNSLNIGACYDNTTFTTGGVQSGIINVYSCAITDAYSRLYVDYANTRGICIPAECNDATQMMLHGTIGLVQSNGCVGAFVGCAVVKRLAGTVSVLSQTISALHKECTGMCACFDTDGSGQVFINVKSHASEIGIAHACVGYQLLRN